MICRPRRIDFSNSKHAEKKLEVSRGSASWIEKIQEVVCPATLVGSKNLASFESPLETQSNKQDEEQQQHQQHSA